MSDTITPETGTETTITPAAETTVVETPKPTETVDFWKQKAREQENRAKQNASAAQRLQEIEDAQKTETQKLADAAAKAQNEAVEARAETARYKVAATHGVGADYFDLLGSGDEAAVTARAEKLAPLIAAHAENVQLKAEIEALKQGKPVPLSNRPVADLKPGATAQGTVSEGDQVYADLFGSN